MYTQLLCTSPHKGASTTILDYTDSPPSQKKKPHPLCPFPQDVYHPLPPITKTPYRLTPSMYPPAPAPQIQIYISLYHHTNYTPVPSPHPTKKNYESQDNNTTTTNKRLGFREIVLATTRLQLPWLRTSWE
jgi:hypothetical protein